MRVKKTNSPKKFEDLTGLERGNRVSEDMRAYDLVVMEPKKGQKGREIFSARIHGRSVSEAVSALREQVNGSGWVVLQKLS